MKDTIGTCAKVSAGFAGKYALQNTIGTAANANAAVLKSIISSPSQADVRNYALPAEKNETL